MNCVREQSDLICVLKEMAKHSKLQFKDFKKGRIIGTGTFGHVRIVFYKKGSQKLPFALKIMEKKNIIDKN